VEKLSLRPTEATEWLEPRYCVQNVDLIWDIYSMTDLPIRVCAIALIPHHWISKILQRKSSLSKNRNNNIGYAKPEPRLHPYAWFFYLKFYPSQSFRFFVTKYFLNRTHVIVVMNRFFFLSFLFTGQLLLAQEITGEMELGGFLLGQKRDVVRAQLGLPIEKEITEDKWIYEFHLFKPDTSVYGLFKYAVWDTTKIYGIQLNGDQFSEMHPFKGLKLGDSKEHAEKILGPFDHSKTYDDPPITAQYYKGKNYSVEIDNKGKIFGIHIFGDILEAMPKSTEPSLHSFHQAVVAKNVDSLINLMMPDVELHREGKVLTYSLGAREEFKRNESEFIKALLGDANSVWYAFAKEYAEGTLTVKPNQPNVHHYTFFDSNLISEIVFKPLAGKWRVSKINFRK